MERVYAGLCSLLCVDFTVAEALASQSHLWDCPAAPRSSQLARGGVWETLALSIQKPLNYGLLLFLWSAGPTCHGPCLAPGFFFPA